MAPIRNIPRSTQSRRRNYQAITGDTTDAPQNPCSFCHNEVRDRQEALQCDRCKSWQHRTCNTGISRSEYREINRGVRDIGIWHCCKCPPPAEDAVHPPMDANPSLDDERIPDPGPLPHEDEDLPLPNDVNPHEVNSSFNISTSFSTPYEPHEETIDDPPVPSILSGLQQPVCWWIIPTGTQRGKPLLVNSHGYSYALKAKDKRRPNAKSSWRCSV